MEDVVSYELAVKLKEKGYDEGCYSYYENKVLRWSTSPWFETQYNNDLPHITAAPTISQVLKWLREEKKIYIMVDRSFSVRGWHYYIIDDDDFENPIQQEVEHNRCYEQAAIDAIEYVLDNLI